uniref:MD-2-related lipid-recognition domain-containing protein n=1 Tax=Stomoxys calcitrans TaxID=35570 RepID=A0A1I8Q129_STOCA
MLLRKWFVLVVMLNFQAYEIVQAAKPRFKLEFYRYDCLNITQHIKVFQCVFEKDCFNSYIFSERLMFDRDLSDNFEMRVWINLKPMNGKKTLRFVDIKFKCCQVLATSLQMPLLKSLLNELWRSSNIPAECPFKGNFIYKMNNFSFTDSYFPPYAPFLNFTFTMEFFDRKTLFAITKITGATVPLT